jgi:AcrR family transcriptional regulator
MNLTATGFGVISSRMNIAAAKRVYRQSARAAAAEATGERIVDAFARQLRERWFDEIRLEEVARDAGVAVQTVIRRFGGKEGLLDAVHQRLGGEIRQRREVAPGDADGAVASLIEDYEEVGDLIMRTLAQEERYAPLKAITDIGRAMHREWIGTAFAPWLDGMTMEQRRRATDALVVAGDIYVWKLLRRDMKRPLAEYQTLLETMCAAAIGRRREEIFKTPARGDGR